MRIIISDANRIWTPDHPALKPFAEIIIVVCRRFIPRVPMSVIVMAAGAALTKLFSLGDYGVPLLPHVESGFIGFGLNFVIPSPDDLSSYLFASLSVAAVILSESLLASRTNAMYSSNSA